MASHIAYLSSLVIAAALVGCGGEDDGSTPILELDYSISVVAGDGSNVGAKASIYDDSGVLLLSGNVGDNGIFDTNINLAPQSLNIEISGGSVIDPVDQEVIDFGYNKLSTQITLKSDETIILSPVNYLTRLARALPLPTSFNSLTGFDVFKTEPINYTKLPTSISDGSKARFLLDGLYRFAHDEGMSPLAFIDLVEYDLKDGRFDGKGTNGVIYLGGELLTTDTYRYRLPLSSVRQAYAAGYLNSEFIAYANQIGTSTSDVIAGGTLFNVSSLSPLVAAKTPLEGASLSGVVDFTFDVSEVLGIESVNVSLNGVSLMSDQFDYVSNENYTGELSFRLNTDLYPNGTNKIDVVISDGIGNSVSESYSYIFNSSAAYISTPYPVGAYVRDAVEVGAYGSYEGAECAVYVDDVIQSENRMHKSNSNCYSNVDTRDMLDGTHTFEVVINAPNGVSDRAVGSFITDNTNPEILLSSPEDGDYVSGIIDIAVYISDSIQVSSGSLYQGQTLLTSSLHQGSYSLDTTVFPDGDTYFKVVAEDSAGNSSQYIFLVKIENTVPGVGDGYPSPGTYSGDVTIGAAGSYENATCSITVDGFPRSDAQIIKSDSDCYSVMGASYLTDGTHTYEIVATTAGGATVSTQGGFTSDNTPPTVSNISPSNDSYISSNFSISANIGDNLQLQFGKLFKDGVLLTTTLQDGAFLVDSASYNDGSTDFTIIAEDAAGNETEAEIPLIFDNTPPEIEITYPFDGDTMTSSFTVRWQQSDTVGFCDDVDASTELIVGGLHYGSAYAHQEQYGVNINNRPEGQNEIKVIVTDCVGHQSEHAINVIFSPN
jgi:hypothetical protein